MYEWLNDALQESGTVITANRRLARVLASEYASQQQASGHKAWQSPAIATWQDWLEYLLANSTNQDRLPTRINAQQSQLLWERCLRKELNDSSAGISNLVRLARDTWQRLADWQVSITDVARSAINDDQRMFASVAGRYLGLLQHEGWVDDAGLGAQVLQLLTDGDLQIHGRHTFVGFERQRPIIAALEAVMAKKGVATAKVLSPDSNSRCSVQAFESTSAELRAAGSWARQQIETGDRLRVAIVTTGLEKEAEQISRSVREGMTPGWQHAHPSLSSALNVSYGQRLSDYPAINDALLLLRWLVQDLPSSDVGLLLRSTMLGSPSLSGRSRIELRLRQLPDRRWSPSMVTAEFRRRDEDEEGANNDAKEWLTNLAAFSKRRRALPKQAAPSEWVVLIDEVLKGFQWPGSGSVNSEDFQLINRWRELLNEFARLGLISARMNPGAAFSRLDLMASETVFQPESRDAAVQLIGPLEASGTEFDRLWLAGVTTANWPPAGTPSQLVSRRLQEKHGMPDCTPANTLDYAQQVLDGLIASSDTVVCSYALTDEDAEQTVSDLIAPHKRPVGSETSDPGWHASTLLTTANPVEVMDAVPPVGVDEKLSGGAAVIDRQLREPLSAFIHSRLSARRLYAQAVGIPAPMRGNLMHDALYKLYIDLPSSEAIGLWQGQELDERIKGAVDFAFMRHERNVDAVLQQLLLLERKRIARLLRQFVALDSSRDQFSIASVEGKFEFVAGSIRLPLRFDRIDTYDDQSIAILDYKTGSKKQLLNRSNEVQEIQLFVYACATEVPVSALTLVNVDSREISFDGAGRGYRDEDFWPELLQRVKDEIAVACDDLSRGDVRLNIDQRIDAARPTNLLSRFTELRRQNG